MPDPARQESPPLSGAFLFPLIAGFMASQVIYVAARLGLADHLGDGAKSSDELGDRDACIVAAPAVAGPGGRRPARGDRSGGIPLDPLRGPAQEQSSRLDPEPGPALRRRVGVAVVGRPPAQRADRRNGAGARLRAGTFEYFARNPELAAVFNEAMTEATRWAAPAVLAVYDFSRFRTVVDVGGGNGTLLGALLAANPGLRGTIFDLRPAERSGGGEVTSRGRGPRSS